MKPFIIRVMKTIQQREKASFEDQGAPVTASHMLLWSEINSQARLQGPCVCFGSQEVMMQLSRDDCDPGWFLGINKSLRSMHS